MSNPFTTEQIQERFESLPTDIQTVISGAETARRLEEIGRQRGLRIDGIGVLIEYSGLVMLGLVKSAEFVSHLSKQLAISREQAEAIAVDVDTQVFSRIRNSLREVQYQSTVESRFQVGSDRGSAHENTPPLESPLPSTPLEPTPEPVPTESVPTSLQETMAPADYSAQKFEQAFETTPPALGPMHTPQAIKPEPYRATLEEEVSVPINSTVTPVGHSTTTPYTDNENRTYSQAAQATINKMPGAVKDAYAAREAAAPKASVPQSAIKDFKTRLEEQLATADNNTVNSDPYKESI